MRATKGDNMFYTVKQLDDFNGILIIFGSEESVQEGSINPDQLSIHAQHNIGVVGDELEDTGEACEDYLICSARYTETEDIPKVKRIVEKFGFIENNNLDNLGWG